MVLECIFKKKLFLSKEYFRISGPRSHQPDQNQKKKEKSEPEDTSS